MPLIRNSGSFRDNRGNIYENDSKIYRSITAEGKSQYEFIRDSKIIEKSTKNGFLITTHEVDKKILNIQDDNIAYVVEHKRIPFISYPYEWSFEQLKEAALLHLNFHIYLLKKNFTLRDASAYNIQFIGSQPIFIDLLSIDKYKENEFWYGYKQFCMQFLNPLLLRSKVGVYHNDYFRGTLEGITSYDLSRMLSYKKFLSLNLFSHVYLHARAHKLENVKKTKSQKKIKSKLSKRAYLAILEQLERWISNLKPVKKDLTIWEKYSSNNTYTNNEKKIKSQVIFDFCKKIKPDVLIDLGCNDGEYSEIAINGGAKYVIGYDFDQKAIDNAFQKSKKQKLPFLSLYLDASNPSPSIGWNQNERYGFKQRNIADAVLALAFEHHLVIGKNIIMSECLEWITSISNLGIIEFVQKNDPTIKEMLNYREDIFQNYNEDNFSNFLSSKAKIINVTQTNEHGRKLFEFKKI